VAKRVRLNPSGKNPGDVWTIARTGRHLKHSATFPEQLVELPILASTPRNGMVLDPFCGIGTTLAVAQRLQRHYLGIDTNAAYTRLARQRLRRARFGLA
jgi:site-specific DNA-methyltransferase (adenine-specific)